MKIKQIKITNFHCYTDSTFDLADQVTVFIGKNGSGKTSLIKAIKNALSVFFSNNPKWGYPSIVGTVSDLGVRNLKVSEVWHDEEMRNADHVEIAMTASWGDRLLPSWSFFKNGNEGAVLQSSYYKDAYVAFMQQYNEVGVLPVFAYYSDRFPHIEANLSPSVKKMLDKEDKLYRCWGYYHWDYDTSCAEIWQKRFIRMMSKRDAEERNYRNATDKRTTVAKSYKENAERFNRELNFVIRFLKTFSDNIDPMLSDKSDTLKIENLMIVGIDHLYLQAVFSDGKRRLWEELPAGYERLYNIVFDLAYRSFILNGPDYEPSGIVFIDELDLHLHPSMEQDALRRLQITFPGIQFIISTHSPLVISNFQQDVRHKIIQMEYYNGVYSHNDVPDLFGMDYDMTISSVMGTEPRNIYLEMLKDKYVRLMKREKLELAADTLRTIQDLVTSARFESIQNELKERLKP